MPIHLSNGRLYGPGVFDMKGGIVQAILPCRLWIGSISGQSSSPSFFNSDEEKVAWILECIVKQVASQCERALIVEPPVGQEGLLKTERKVVVLRLTIEGLLLMQDSIPSRVAMPSIK